jgi:hypothetical protein
MGGSYVGGDCGNVCPILFVEDGCVEDLVEDFVHLSEDKHLILRFTRLADCVVQHAARRRTRRCAAGFLWRHVTVVLPVLTHHDSETKQNNRNGVVPHNKNTTKTVSAFRPMRQGNGPSRGKGGAPKVLIVQRAFVQQKLVLKGDGSLAVAALPEVPVPDLPPLFADPAPERPAETEPELQARLAVWRDRGECALPSCFRLRLAIARSRPKAVASR